MSPACSGARSPCRRGAFEYKVAINESFDENYGAGGAPGGANIALTAPGGAVTFTYNHNTHVITDDLPKSVTSERAAHWVSRDLIAWNLPDERAGFSYRLYWAAEGGLVNDDGTITGGSSVPLQLDASGLPASVRREFPHLASYEVLRVPASLRSRIPAILTGQIAVAAFDADRRTGLGDRRPDARRPGRHLPRCAAAQPRPDLASGPADGGGVGSHREEGHAAAGPGRRGAGATGRDAAGRRRGVERSGAPRLAQRPLPVRGHGVRAHHRHGGGEPGDRPVLGRPDHQLAALGAGRSLRPGAEAGRLEPAGQAGAAQAGVLLDL